MRWRDFRSAFLIAGEGIASGFCLLAIAVCGAAPVAFAPDLPAPGRPRVYYTDLASGPNRGGENDQGVYLSIFGKGFGAGGAGARVKVYVGQAEVARYLYLGPSKGRPDIEQITVQIGRLGDPAQGVRLPLLVVADGQRSNDDRTFTVNPGRVLFVDNVRGNDATARAGDIAHPYRNVQTGDPRAAAYGRAEPGDVIVMRGTGTPWTATGFENYFLKFFGKSGSAPTGAPGTGPIAVIAYPGEDVFIRMPGDGTNPGAISAVNGGNYPGKGQWVTVADLRIEGGGHDGPVNLQIQGNHWRVVNNDLTAQSAGGSARAGGITGNGEAAVFLGNHIHDVAGDGQHNHGIYIDGDGSYEIAYNLIERVSGGNGLQLYANGSNGSDSISNVAIHHNLIRDVAKHGINVADGAQDNIAIFDNVIANVDLGAIRFNTRTLHHCRIYSNTLYGSNRKRRSPYAAVVNDWNLPSDALDFRNNIVVPSPGTEYAGGTVGLSDGVGTISHNLWYGGAGPVAFDDAPVAGDPRFVEAGVDFHLRAGSSAIDAGSSSVAVLVTSDFDITTARPSGARFDVGAFEHSQPR